MLSITNRRHLAKENVIQYERLQKDNDEILRQIHDLRKQMKLLNNKTIEENDNVIVLSPSPQYTVTSPEILISSPILPP